MPLTILGIGGPSPRRFPHSWVQSFLPFQAREGPVQHPSCMYIYICIYMYLYIISIYLCVYIYIHVNVYRFQDLCICNMSMYTGLLLPLAEGPGIVHRPRVWDSQRP